MTKNFYWYDYETWGVDCRVDRPCQFAGVRTDLNFNVIEEPEVLYCQPAPDVLPQPMACLITGITPQHAEKNGVREYQFAAAIHRAFSKPATCVVGYNNIRFDDEVTRHLFYRNFYDPYEREWSNGNSRWDIIDLVRACYALRPEGIAWPMHDDGKVSFKLEDLTAANNLSHAQSHNALSDVFATIEVAKLIKQKQPKLFEYLFQLRSKHKVSEFINLETKKPILHISGMFPVERKCAAIMMPLAKHPVNSNEIICYDLSVDPDPLIELSVEEVQQRIFSGQANLAVARIPIKNIRINHCPVVCGINNELAERLQIDRHQCDRHQEKLLAATGLNEKLRLIFSNPERIKITDPEQMLYTGFFQEVDRKFMRQVQKSQPDELRNKTFPFTDERLPEMLFRYRARNFNHTLSSEEYEQWREFCRRRFSQSDSEANNVIATFRTELQRLYTEHQQDDKAQKILGELERYVNLRIAEFQC